MIPVKRIHRFLRAVFDEEASAGFPRLARVPDTYVRHFLDYYRGLTAEEQSELAAASTLWGTHTLSRSVIRAPSAMNDGNADIAGGARAVGAIEGIDVASLKSNAALTRLRAEMWNGSHRDPYRYSSVPLLRLYRAEATMRRKAGEPPPSEWHGMMDDYAASVHGAKAPALRKLLRQLIEERFGGRATKGSGGGWMYEGDLRGDRVMLSVDYGGRSAQLRYSFRVDTTAGTLDLSRGFEASLGAGLGDWDFLTEENAAESIALLGDFIEQVARWPAQLSEGD
ncbi:MAG: hypothetical protein ACHQWU_02820 [Gemmatimonadales bacterium]